MRETAYQYALRMGADDLARMGKREPWAEVNLDYDLFWVAVDARRYDGAHDAHPHSRLIGYGRSPSVAVADLKSKIEELGDDY